MFYFLRSYLFLLGLGLVSGGGTLVVGAAASSCAILVLTLPCLLNTLLACIIDFPCEGCKERNTAESRQALPMMVMVMVMVTMQERATQVLCVQGAGRRLQQSTRRYRCLEGASLALRCLTWCINIQIKKKYAGF